MDVQGILYIIVHIGRKVHNENLMVPNKDLITCLPIPAAAATPTESPGSFFRIGEL